MNRASQIEQWKMLFDCFFMALFSNFVAFRGEKANCLCFHVKIAYIFERRAVNLI